MNKVVAIARWEYLDKVRKKSFWIGVFLTPVIWVVMGVVPTLLASKEDEHTKTVGIVDMTDSLQAPLQTYLDGRFHLSDGSPNYRLQELPVDKSQPADTIRHRADVQVFGSLVENYLFVPSALAAAPAGHTDTVEYRGTSVSNIRDGERLERAVRSVLLEQQLRRRGIDVASYRGAERDVDLRSIEVSRSGESHEKGFGATFGVAYVFLILLMMLTMMSGGMLVRSMVEEKSTRIIEVLFSSAAPRDIMMGKVIGLSAVGMTQIGVLIALGIVALTQVSFDLSSLKDVPLMCVYFVLGYTMYTAIFVGLGSIVTTEQEAQQVTGYLSLGLIVPFVFIFSAMQNPNDTLMRVLSQIPFFAPSFMMIRLPVHHPAWWEIALSLVTVTLTILGIVALSSKIFRIAMLMYGKRPTLKELVRLARS